MLVKCIVFGIIEVEDVSNLPVEKRILYSTVYCAYREYRERGIRCHHPKSFGVCDLDVCPIVQIPFASIVFQHDGIYLMIKRPSDDSLVGEWEKIKLELNLDEPDETINFVEGHLEGLNEKNKEYVLRKLNNIIERYKFLKSKGKSIPIIEEEVLPEEKIEEEEVPSEEGLEELAALEEIETEPKKSEPEKIEEEEIEELELLDLDELEEESEQ